MVNLLNLIISFSNFWFFIAFIKLEFFINEKFKLTRIADKQLTWKIRGLEPSVELPHQTHNSSPDVQ